MGFKERYAQNKIKKIAQKINRSVIVPDLNKAKTIGVIWQPSQKEAFLFLKEYFTREQTIFRSFCVFDELTNPQPDSNTVTMKDLNWLGLPYPEKHDDFTGTNFDILFNISISHNIVLNYLTLISQAKFKVGSSINESNFFDLNINIGEKDDAMYLVKQQIFYLSQLNKTTN